MRQFPRGQQWIVASTMYAEIAAPSSKTVAQFHLRTIVRDWRRGRDKTVRKFYRLFFPRPEADPVLLPIYELKLHGVVTDAWTLVPVVVIRASGADLPDAPYMVVDAVAPPAVGNVIQLLVLRREISTATWTLHNASPHNVTVVASTGETAPLYQVAAVDPKE